MPINVYTGATGAGKTYQVMEHLILPNIAQGRSIVTNIEGIDVDAVYHYILNDQKLCDFVKRPDDWDSEKEPYAGLGSFRMLHDADIEAADGKLFPYIEVHKATADQPARKDYIDTDSVVKKGELVIVDEAANWWGGGCKISKRDGQFFREHRHFVNEKGESCDIVFIAQDVTYLHRSLRAQGGIKYTFFAEKMDGVGLDKMYILKMYKGSDVGKRFQPERVELPAKYKPEIYVLYSSYAEGSQAKEKAIDKRQNVLNNKKKWITVGVLTLIMLVAVLFAGRTLYRFFKPPQKEDKAEKVSPASSSTPASSVPAAPVQAVPKDKEPSASWRVAGYYYSSFDRITFMFVKDQKIRYVFNPFKAKIMGRSVEVQIEKDGEIYTDYSGVGAGSQKGVF